MAQRICSVEGCGRPVGRHGARGMCPRHYQAHRLAGAAAPCTIAGCEKPSHCRGLCPMHYQRWRIRGDAGPPTRERQQNVGMCSAEGCEQPMRKTGLCASHYSQKRERGEVAPFVWKWGDGGYFATHALIQRRRGPASDRACVDCGAPAEEWSYDGHDPDERTDGSGLKYSRDMEHYEPRCIPCHRRFDEWRLKIS